MGGAAAGALQWRAAFAESEFTSSRYAAAIVIDALGGPGGEDPSAPDDAPLTPKALADVVASGITAVNVTVNEPGNGPDRYQTTIADIARMEREIAAHPDLFLKVLRGSDLALAKSSGRLGLIFGFQDTSMFDGDLGRIAEFYGLGLRICQPTYNVRNLIGDGCMESADGGLEPAGIRIHRSGESSAHPARSEPRRSQNHSRGHCRLESANGHNAHGLSRAG